MALNAGTQVFLYHPSLYRKALARAKANCPKSCDFSVDQNAPLLSGPAAAAPYGGTGYHGTEPLPASRQVSKFYPLPKKIKYRIDSR